MEFRELVVEIIGDGDLDKDATVYIGDDEFDIGTERRNYHSNDVKLMADVGDNILIDRHDYEEMQSNVDNLEGIVSDLNGTVETLQSEIHRLEMEANA